MELLPSVVEMKALPTFDILAKDQWVDLPTLEKFALEHRELFGLLTPEDFANYVHADWLKTNPKRLAEINAKPKNAVTFDDKMFMWNAKIFDAYGHFIYKGDERMWHAPGDYCGGCLSKLIAFRHLLHAEQYYSPREFMLPYVKLCLTYHSYLDGVDPMIVISGTKHCTIVPACFDEVDDVKDVHTPALCIRSKDDSVFKAYDFSPMRGDRMKVSDVQQFWFVPAVQFYPDGIDSRGDIVKTKTIWYLFSAVTLKK